ncbi:unnamed protein product [marine sediment metagenome]|uniref:Uncharacterized protein n=1 Tax=marine sediment metagenome TaxID=412755 RepID=X1TJ34_9ZZZZ
MGQLNPANNPKILMKTKKYIQADEPPPSNANPSITIASPLNIEIITIIFLREYLSIKCPNTNPEIEADHDSTAINIPISKA